ncbi:MAG: DUF1345 domain-containing protein [Nesterenkonia sp.]|uniref:DUF1345 domain-containing protein n=1 Tax=Nesterenkonia marinintestina TaxID=2979865 RepID=UPI0021BEDABC|nr:DUF1345 domain-containing protein [Nesterenkonia sp. GX14115]MDO5493267.1 DUF1345 domain-containing protein [Nesterenkonia sp.]
MGRRSPGRRTTMRARLQSEVLRSLIASCVAATLIVPLWTVDLLPGTATGPDGPPAGWEDFLRAAEAAVLMVAWIAFAGLYLLLTHTAFHRLSAGELHAVGARQHRRKLSLGDQLKGVLTAEQLTVAAAGAAAMFAILIAQSGQFRNSAPLIVLGLLTVACAWGLMVTSFALQYMRMHAAGEPMDFPLHEEPVFSDYMTLSVLTSTLLGHDVQFRSSRGWKVQRRHTMLSFGFNTVILAMTISLLFGGLGSGG